jgi:hypothetical protein
LTRFERKLTLALQEQRKDAQNQFQSQKLEDVNTLVQTEKRMKETVEHYDSVTFDLNVEKTKYSELALQLQDQSEQLLQKLRENDKAKSLYANQLSALEKKYATLQQQNNLSQGQATEMKF